MADNYNIYQQCPRCRGARSVPKDDQPYDGGPPDTEPCPRCEGEGEIFWGEMREEDEE